MDIAFLELEKLLTSLPGRLSDADIKAAWNIPDHEKFTAAVKALHLQILHQLVDNHPQLSAYQLGRALSDTCWLPDEKAGGESSCESSAAIGWLPCRRGSPRRGVRFRRNQPPP